MSKIFAFSEAASIALHSMVLIAKSDEIINVSVIADTIGSSKHHIAKILQRLVKDGFINSLRGPTGGFSLKKKPAKISFLDIYEAIEGKINITSCPLEKDVCPFDKECIMNKVTSKMEKEFKEYMQSQTLDYYLN
jgi:Rrf2 family protein